MPTPFYSALVSTSAFMALSSVFHFMNSPDNSPFSHCSSGLISALLVLSTTYLFVTVSLSPDIILRGCRGLKQQLTNSQSAYTKRFVARVKFLPSSAWFLSVSLRK